MKMVNANEVRARYIEALKAVLAEEDLGMIASNSFNFPVVSADGEEGWVEIVVKVTKETGDEGYGKREEYDLKVKASEERAKAKAEKVAKAKAKAEKA